MNECQVQAFDIDDRGQLGISELEHYLSIVELYYPEIELEFESMGTQYTLEDYPDPAVTPVAKEWNRVAQLNNRLEILLLPNEGEELYSMLN